ncbi:class I SAM-dependent methyltransferase [Actinophytocola sp.]|uniref:class I SAM-dependent methyltransferase n=1 Tax=Actinophytocola sp. TaxID=1872138 RepID=UPI00389B1293
MTNDPDTHARALAAASESPTDWFEELYNQAQRGDAIVPWDRGTPHDLLASWAGDRDGAGLHALVVGCGLGRDSEYLASLHYETVAFDVSPTAVASTRDRFPGTAVDYRVADLLDPPADWHHAFDLVVESLTVQALPVPLHEAAIERVASFVAPGGTLLVIAAARDGEARPEGPPWPLTRTEIESFATGGLTPHDIVRDEIRWRAEFRRPATTS